MISWPNCIAVVLLSFKTEKYSKRFKRPHSPKHSFKQSTSLRMRPGYVNLNSTVNMIMVNATSPGKLQPVRYEFTASYFELVVLCLLITAILIGNSFVCLAFKAVSRRLKTITNSFVISLAMSDILVGAFSLPLWLALRLGKRKSSSYCHFISICH